MKLERERGDTEDRSRAERDNGQSKRIDGSWLFGGGLCHGVPVASDWSARRILLPPSRGRIRLLPELTDLPYLPYLLLNHSCLLHLSLFYVYPGFPPPSPSAPFKMFRSAVVRSLRASMPRVVRTPAPFHIRSSPIARPSQIAPAFSCQAVRLYSAPAGLKKEEVEGRIVNLLKNFDKVSRETLPRTISETNPVLI